MERLLNLSELKFRMETKWPNGYLNIMFLLYFSIVTPSNFEPKNYIKEDPIGHVKERKIGRIFEKLYSILL